MVASFSRDESNTELICMTFSFVSHDAVHIYDEGRD